MQTNWQRYSKQFVQNLPFLKWVSASPFSCLSGDQLVEYLVNVFESNTPWVIEKCWWQSEVTSSSVSSTRLVKQGTLELSLRAPDLDGVLSWLVQTILPTLPLAIITQIKIKAPDSYTPLYQIEIRIGCYRWPTTLAWDKSPLPAQAYIPALWVKANSLCTAKHRLENKETVQYFIYQNKKNWLVRLGTRTLSAQKLDPEYEVTSINTHQVSLKHRRSQTHIYFPASHSH